MEERNMVVDSPLELSIAQTLISVCRWSMLSTAGNLRCRQYFTESWDLSEFGFAGDNAFGMSITFCFWANLRWFLNLILIQIQNFQFLFLQGLYANKQRVFLLLLNLVLDRYNQISLPIYLENIGNCRTSLNSRVLTFFLLFTCSCDWSLFSSVVLCC